MITSLWKKIFQNRHQSWTFYGQLTRIASGLIFIGVLARTLPTEVLAIWYIFGAMFGFASLVEMGLGQVYSRHVAYMKSDYDSGKCSWDELTNFVRQGERFYFYLSGIISLIALFAGSWWLTRHNPAGFDNNILLEWFLYISGGACLIVGMFYGAVLNGVGEIWRTQKIAIISAWSSIVFLLLLFVAKGSLIVPVLAYLISQFVSLALGRHALVSMSFIGKLKAGTVKIDKSLFDTVKGDTLKMFLIMASFQILTSGFVLILSAFFPHAVVASYGLTMQFVWVVLSISTIWSGTAFFEMASSYKRGEHTNSRRIFWSAFKRSALVCLLGMLGVFFFAPLVVQLLHSKTPLLEMNTMAVLLAVIWGEFIFTLFSQFCMSQGDMRVAYYYLVGSLCICAVSILLLDLGYSIVVVFLARLVIIMLSIGLPSWIMSADVLARNPKLALEKTK